MNKVRIKDILREDAAALEPIAAGLIFFGDAHSPAPGPTAAKRVAFPAVLRLRHPDGIDADRIRPARDKLVKPSRRIARTLPS
jgi:hypothetical protein